MIFLSLAIFIVANILFIAYIGSVQIGETTPLVLAVWLILIAIYVEAGDQ